MRVFGDQVRVEDPREAAARVRGLADRAVLLRDPLARHVAWVSGLIEAGMLAQGLLDARFDATAEDTWSQPELGWVRPFADAVVASWNAGMHAVPAQPPSLPRPEPGWPEQIRMKVPEGFAFYALYPEAYAVAARALPRCDAVLGIRSIGTGLGAVVASACDARTFATVRPVGPPYERRLSFETRAAAWQASGSVAVVDEGPGLSGSSFIAAAREVEARGATPHLLPGHGNPPGARATLAARAHWQRLRRHPASFEEVALADPERGLARWLESFIGSLDEPLVELSGGAWRAQHGRPDLPVDAARERRKVLVRAGGRRWLLKFAGLGSMGEETFARARVLAQGGFSPEVLGLAHGFLIQPWCEGAPCSERDALEPAFLERIGRYLAWRCQRLPRPGAASGASASTLFEMLACNVQEGLGAEAAENLARWRPGLARLDAQVRRVETDNRLHAWEWLRTSRGWLKTDGVDHAHGHTLVGCQDLAWDLAGARFELGLDADARARIDQMLLHDDVPLPAPELRAFHERAYLAFQLGLWTFAREGAAPEELPGTTARVERYRGALTTLLTGD